MNTFSRELVFVRLLVPFLMGIPVAIFISPGWPAFAVPSGVFLFAFVLFHNSSLLQRPSLEWIQGLVLSLLFFSLGGVLVHLNKDIDRAEHFSRKYLPGSTLMVRVTEPPTAKGTYVKVPAQVLQMQVAQHQYETGGQILLYLPADARSQKVNYGDILITTSEVQEVAPPANPYEFNYRQYLSYKQVYHQSYAFAQQWHFANENTAGSFGMFYKARMWCMNILGRYLTAEALAMTSSLLLGYRDLLNDELVQAYSATGTVHILSVSGMHLGLIVLLLDKVLQFLGSSRRSRAIKLVLMLIAIWLFACLSGLSPSVSRAAVMFTFLQTGRSFARPANSFNSVASSAMFLLILDPFLVMDIGFQLSYLAVAGIMLLYDKIYNLINIPWKPVDWLWQSVCVSLAATISTLPLTIYYFHQVPLFSIPANLVIVPVSSAVMFLGMLLLVASLLVPRLAAFLGVITNYLVKGMNYLTYYIASVPDATYGGISISIPEMLLMLMAIVFAVAFIHLRRPQMLLASLMMATTLLTADLMEETRQLKQNKLIVYSLNKHSAVELVAGQKSLLITDEALLSDKRSYHWHVGPNQWAMGTSVIANECIGDSAASFNHIPFRRQGEYLQTGDKRIVILSDYNRSIAPAGRLKVDYVILTGNVKADMTKLTALYDFDLVIFDASNSKEKVERWVEGCRDLGIKYYDIYEKGAFIAEFQPGFAASSQ